MAKELEKQNLSLIPQEVIENKIFFLRDRKVILDKDLAVLYGVETRVLIQTVKRNIDRFPKDFMFQLTKEEFNNLISQFVTSSWGGTRKLPYAFTEQGSILPDVCQNSICDEISLFQHTNRSVFQPEIRIAAILTRL